MKKIHLFISICFISGFAHAQTEMVKLSEWDDYSQYFNCTWYNGEGCFYDIWGYVDGMGGEYAILGAFERTLFIDISSPGSPNLVTCSPIATGGGSWQHRDIQTYKEYAYVVSDPGVSQSGLEIYDLSDLPNPNPDIISLTSEWSYPPQFTYAAHNSYIDVPSDRLFLFGLDQYQDGRGILMTELYTDPEDPQFLDYYDVINSHDLFVRNNTLYACSWEPNLDLHEMRIFDISTNLFVPITTFAYPDDQSPQLPLETHPPHSIWLTEDGKYMVTSDEHDGGAAIFWDIQDVFNITETDRYPAKFHPDGKMHNLHIRGNFLYIAHFIEGLVVLDISDINNVIEVANYDTYANIGPIPNEYAGAWGVFPYLPSCNIIVSDMKSGLFVLTFPDDEVLLNETIAAGVEKGFVAKNTITATNYIVESGAGSNLVAGVEVVIDGESVIEGEFIARIEDPCAQSTFQSQKTAGGSSGNETNLTEKQKNNQSSITNQESSIYIHPNPTSGEFTIQVTGDVGQGTSEVYIYDIFGRLVEQLTMSNGQLTIDISRQPKGIYMVKVLSGEKVYTQKLIHQ